MSHLSRRQFVTLGAAGAFAAPFVLYGAPMGSVAVTAQEIVDRIKKTEVPVQLVKAGEPFWAPI